MIATAGRNVREDVSAAFEQAYVFPSELGWMALSCRNERLTRLTFGHPSASAAAVNVSADIPLVSDQKELPTAIQLLIERLQRFAAGEPDDFTDVPLDLGHLTDFQRRVVNACRRIKAGKSRSYADLAVAAGSPRAARAVGNVMRGNRFPLIVPCHRVIGSDGKLCGFTSPQGLAMKEKLLDREGAWKAKAR